ncbi:MAG: N-acetylmuramoyl-L-alanine amidase [Syntrophobacterales bacterium]|nr:MAG: N-acetylmuramoyl-L-alanine amidase [Syntrophobacterales bacterium]
MEIKGRKFWTTLSSLSFTRISPSPSSICHRILAKPSFIKGFIHTSAILFILLGLFFPTPPASGSDYENQYRKARNDYYALKNSETKKKYRSYWLRCIEEFRAIYTKYPKSPRSDDALFTVAILYNDLYSYSFLKSDLQKALSSFQSLVKRYPSSRLADDAQFKIGEIHLRRKEFSKAYEAFQKVVDQFPKGDMVSLSRLKLIGLKNYKPKPKKVKRLSPVTEIRYWSNPDYTRVVIYVDKQVPYKEHLLKRDPSIKKPQRLYIDIDSARISPNLKQPIPIHDGLLKMARAAQNSPDTVRVVLDIESIRDYKILPLNDPFRLVIDIFGASSSEGKALAAIEEKRPLLPPSEPGIRRIIIDPGHGGRDPGAIGPRGLKEKDVVLKIAKRLKEKLKKQGYEVFLTRERDIYLPLEERTAIANTKNADLFLSIHANASRKRGARGIETYILGPPSDDEIMELAARENAISTKKLTDLDIILYSLKLTARVNDSSRLAQHVQESMCNHLNHRKSSHRDRGIKQAPFYVLMGARMPAILAEVSFISNRAEEKKLRSRKYLDKIAVSIAEGLHGYIEETRAAHRPPPSQRKTSLKTKSPLERIIEGRMERGSCLYTVLKKGGVSPHQIALITSHLKPIFDFKDCNPGDSFQVSLDEGGELQTFLYEAGLTDLYEVKREDGRYLTSKKEVILDRHLNNVKGNIESTLFDAIEKTGEGDHLALAFADIFAWEIDFHNDPRKGDCFNILVEKFYKNDRFIRYGNVLAAAYHTPSKVYSGFYFKNPSGQEGYYDEKGRSLEKSLLCSPLRFTRITSGYNRRRRHPILGGYHPHLAIDYAAPTGTPVRSVGDGRVIFCGWNRGYGKQVAIRHPNGYTTYYAHLSRFARGIKKGKRVKQKQVIGYVGSTGLATGPHLDYRIAKNGKFLDPITMKSPPISSIRERQLSAFQAQRDRLASLLQERALE